MIWILSFLIISLAHQCSQHIPPSTGRSAICILHPEGNSTVKGIVSMHQTTIFQPLYYQFTVVGLNTSSYHGVHIHQYGDLTEGCKSAGPHYNPYHLTHGGRIDFNRHAGDLGNLRSDFTGASQMCISDRVTTLYGVNSIIGRSVVVHRNRDDLGRGGDIQSTKTGNAGPRMACGVIGLSSEFKHFYLDKGLMKSR